MYTRAYVEITNICNMACSFCHGHSRKPARMDAEQFARVLNQLSGTTQYIYYHLMGEPLTHPQLPEFIQMATEKGFRSVITTNGTLLAKRGEQLIHSGLHKVSISLHSFEKDNADAQEQYLAQCAVFAGKAAEKGIFISFRLWNRGVDGGNNEKTLAALRRYLPGDWQENSRGYRIRDRIFLEYGDRFAWPDTEAPDMGQAVYCYGLKDHFGILCDGTVVPCCLDSDGVIALGNVFTQELGEILYTPRAEAMRRGFACRKASEDLCRRCGYARRF